MADEMMMHGNGLSSFETYMISEKNSRRPSGAAITGLVLGSLGLAVGAGAWIFGGTYAASRAKSAEALANVQFQATNNQLNLLTNLLAAERNERVAQGITLSNTVNDSVSGSQQGTLTAQQAAELSSIQSIQQNLLNQAVLGNLSENPQKVQIYSAPQPCGCPCGS